MCVKFASCFSISKISVSLSAQLTGRFSAVAKCYCDMGTEILPEVCFSPAPSSFDRPFRIHVQDRTFLIDAESMRKISPVFSVMCYGKDFEGGRELSRDIVDEKCDDIDVFLRAVHDNSVISATNFALILRLSHKYQVLPVIDACQEFVKRTDLNALSPDEILTLLMAAYEFHCQREVLVQLIRRLANESNAVFARLRISRFLPAQIYGAVISASMNLAQLREYEGMNGHCLKMERSKTRWRNSVCEQCRAICDQCATCEECKKSLCKRHVNELKCTTNYGKKLITELRENIVELDWND
ncbi:unnamed protein product [Cylicocyclus nassatus]|uniref:BTB domain-containing protein n=1 Tax=Cylicocyclus nassatus TaxID=53992 RepID=A0AA36H6L2_CYLNA|nr:unnamed protein product [Cylicocyclus nassatus]